MKSLVRKRARKTILRAYKKQLREKGWRGLYEVHHIVPASFQRQFGDFLDDVGYQIDSVKNFVTLPKQATKQAGNLPGAGRTAHQGWRKGHAEYNRQVSEQLLSIRDSYARGQVTRDQAREAVEALSASYRQDLVAGRIDLTDAASSASSAGGAVAIGLGLVTASVLSPEEAAAAEADAQAEEIADQLMSRDRAKNEYIRYGTGSHWAPEEGFWMWVGKGVDFINPIADVKDITDILEDLSGTDWVTGESLVPETKEE